MNGIMNTLAFFYPLIAAVTKIVMGFTMIFGIFFIAVHRAFDSTEFITWTVIVISVSAAWIWIVCKIERRYEQNRQRRVIE
jgi:uncharacterized membrane-anchored protein